MNRKFINNKADITLICICLFLYFSVYIIYILWGFIKLIFFACKGTEGKVMLDNKEGWVSVKCFSL